MMVSESMAGALKTLAERLRSRNLRWVLVGSISLALQDVDVTPADIDVKTDKAGAYKINELLKDCEVKPVKYRLSDTMRSHLGEFRIKDVKVEVIGEFQEKVKGRWHGDDSPLTSPTIIQFEGIQLPVSSLQTELRFYETAGREKDIAKIAAIRTILNNHSETEEPKKEG
jgi:hypothetical protein